ncbi:MAG: hypothetical protein ACE5GQ_05570 [Nitrospinales bacterium]
MNAIKTLLAMLFVLFLSSFAFAQTHSAAGIASDVTGAQIVAGQAGGDDPVNFKRGRGGGGNADDGTPDKGRGGGGRGGRGGGHGADD